MELKQAVQANFDQQVKALQGLLKIKSVECIGENRTPFGQGTKDCLDYCLNLGKEMGFKAVNLHDRCGYLEYGEGEEMIAVLGHLDVVPEGTGWIHDPYGAEIDGDRLYARGAIDDKGPMMAALYALKAAVDSGAELKRRVRVIFGLNEETGCACMQHYVNCGEEQPVLGFTPDGDFPLINGEKGICAAYYTFPLGGSIRRFSGGTALNMVPAMAEAVLNLPAEALKNKAAEGIAVSETDEGLLVSAQGQSAHGSTPEKGVNAIVRLAAFLKDLELDAASKQLVETIAKLYPQGTIGEKLGIDLHDDVSGNMVVNLGTAETRDGLVTIGVNLRVPVTFGEKDFHRRLTSTMGGQGFYEKTFHFTPPLYIPADAPLIQILRKVYEEETGLDGTPECIGGGTYAKTMPNIVAFGPIFPGEPCVEHEPEEFISLTSFQKMTEIYAKAIVELANA